MSLMAVVEFRRTKVSGSTSVKSHHQRTCSTPPVTKEPVLVATARTAVECLLVYLVREKPTACRMACPFKGTGSGVSDCLSR